MSAGEADNQRTIGLLDRRIEQLEQEMRDATIHWQNMSRELADLTIRFNAINPPRKNCPKCGKLVNTDARRCGVCSATW